MKISRKSEYAILGLLYLTRQEKGIFIKISDIIEETGISKDLLLKIFNHLVQKEILESKAGVGGGFRLRKDPSQISLLDILSQFETFPNLNECTGSKGCRKKKNCDLAEIWNSLQEDINNVFDKVKFDSLAHKK